MANNLIGGMMNSINNNITPAIVYEQAPDGRTIAFMEGEPLPYGYGITPEDAKNQLLEILEGSINLAELRQRFAVAIAEFKGR